MKVHCFKKWWKSIHINGAPVHLVSSNILDFFCLHLHCRKTKRDYIIYKFIRYVSTLWSSLDLLYVHGSMKALIISWITSIDPSRKRQLNYTHETKYLNWMTDGSAKIFRLNRYEDRNWFYVYENYKRLLSLKCNLDFVAISKILL